MVILHREKWFLEIGPFSVFIHNVTCVGKSCYAFLSRNLTREAARGSVGTLFQIVDFTVNGTSCSETRARFRSPLFEYLTREQLSIHRTII